MALEKEIWIADIQEQLFQANPFMSRATDHSQFVNYKTVHVPQAGANQGVKKNRLALPAAINQRADSELTYSLNEYTSDPILLTKIEELQISYSKRQSVLANTISTLSEAVANQSLYAWAPSGAGRILRTSGSAVGTALAPGASGTRKAITLDDIAALKAKLDNDKGVPQDGRILLMPSDIYNTQFLAISEVKQAYAWGQANLPSGVVGRVMGFEIMLRPNTLVYDNTGTPVIKSISDDGTVATTATSDNLGILAYHPRFVAHALGEIQVFSDEDKPEYYGSIFSSLVMHGASKLRTDQVGVAALVQTT